MPRRPDEPPVFPILPVFARKTVGSSTDINPPSREEFRRSTFEKKFGVTQSYARERRYIPNTSQTGEDPIESQGKGILLFRSKRILEGTTSVLLHEPRKSVALYNATLTGNLLARCTTRRMVSANLFLEITVGMNRR